MDALREVAALTGSIELAERSLRFFLADYTAAFQYRDAIRAGSAEIWWHSDSPPTDEEFWSSVKIDWNKGTITIARRRRPFEIKANVLAILLQELGAMETASADGAPWKVVPRRLKKAWVSNPLVLAEARRRCGDDSEGGRLHDEMSRMWSEVDPKPWPAKLIAGVRRKLNARS